MFHDNCSYSLRFIDWMESELDRNQMQFFKIKAVAGIGSWNSSIGINYSNDLQSSISLTTNLYV